MTTVDGDAYQVLRNEAKRLRRCNDAGRAAVDAALVTLAGSVPRKVLDSLLDVRNALRPPADA